MISYLRSDSIDPQVMVEAASSQSNASKSTGPGTATLGIFDPAIKIADRRREAAALLLAASLYITDETLQGRPPQNVEVIVSGLIEHKLMPPEVSMSARSGVLTSPHSCLYLRYRPTSHPGTFGVETVSGGRERSDGPALLIRLSGDEQDKAVDFHQATQTEYVTIPQPFAPASALIAAGWTDD